MLTRTLYFACVTALLAPAISAQSSDTYRFLASHCVACHSGAEAEAGLDLEVLKGELTAETFEVWQQIHDRVTAGEMPPADSDQAPTVQRLTFLKQVATESGRCLPAAGQGHFPGG